MNKNPYIVLEAATLIILVSKSDVCMSSNSKDKNYTMHIARRVHFVINGENSKNHKIRWCEGGLQSEKFQLRMLEIVIYILEWNIL